MSEWEEEWFKENWLREHPEYHEPAQREATYHLINDPMFSPLGRVDILNKAVERAIREERERIIALLSEYKERLYDDANSAAESGDDPVWDIERAEAVEICIALIKGEN